jgi:hydroxypyruvate reductase
MKEKLDLIFRAALKRVDPYLMLKNGITCSKDKLEIVSGQYNDSFDLNDFDRIVVIGTGKASAVMAKAMEEILADKLSQGLIITKYGFSQELSKIEVIEAGHPVPDQNSVKAAQRIAEIARQADEKTLVICLISGGGSSLMAAPYNDNDLSLTLEDKQAVTRTLLACGADISEINCLRKHLSLVKGGKLAQLLYPATTVCLILSDVVGDSLDTIASGPTSPDLTNFKDVESIIEKYEIWDKLPKSARKLIELGIEGKSPDTPVAESQAFQNVHNYQIGTNNQALIAAANKAKEFGFETEIMTDCLKGEAKEVAKSLFAIARNHCRNGVQKPKLFIFGGETTVVLSEDHGKGGRNQEMALAFLNMLKKSANEMSKVTFLTASTDGNDGPTDAAGAWASIAELNKAKKQNLNPDKYLKKHDAYHFFDKIDNLYKTGPTKTNVCDIQLLLIMP